MNITFRSGPELLKSCYDPLKKTLFSFISTIHAVLVDPNGFQKIGLLALSILQTINCVCGKNYLSRFIKKLDIANSLDFYAFLKIPYYWLYPYHVDRINVYPTLAILQNTLTSNLSADPHFNPSTVKQFSKEVLESYFNFLGGNEDDYKGGMSCKNENHFKEGLQRRILRKIEDDHLGWDPTRINLVDFHPVLNSFSILKTVTDCTFMAVDIACAAFFWQEWEMVHLGHYANKIGEYRLFRWVRNQILDDWIRAGLCVGFALQIVEAVQCLITPGQDESARKAAYWQTAVAVSEIVFNLTVLFRCNECAVAIYTAIAKGIGVLSIAYSPSKNYFPGPQT